jgi:hypothetical protein
MKQRVDACPAPCLILKPIHRGTRSAGLTICVFTHALEHDSLPITSLICKQVIPYRTCGGTCCPRVFIPKNRSLVDLS